MRLGLRTKQVAGVTALVALAEAALLLWYMGSLAHLMLEDSRAKAKFLAQAIYQRTFTVVSRSGADAATAIKDDEGLRNILEATAYSDDIIYAVITDRDNRIVAEDVGTRIGEVIEARESLEDLVDTRGSFAQLDTVFLRQGPTLEVRQPLGELGMIRVGVNMGLVRSQAMAQLRTPAIAAAVVLVASIILATFLAQLVLRPIHVIRSGLARLGKGELGVNVELPADAELADIGSSFQQVRARLEADRTELAGQRAIESVVDQLEDAVALFSPDGTLLFSNSTMDATIDASPEGREARSGKSASPSVQQLWPADHPYRLAVESALAGGGPHAPEPVTIPQQGDRLVLTNLVPGAEGQPLGVVLVSRNLTYLSQVESTLSYSRKLAALSRLYSGIAHEIKNPLNATMIHLELLRMELAGHPEALQHVATIVDQVRRLDAVTQGLVKFTRAEVLHLQAIELASVFERVRPVLDTEAAKHGVELHVEVPADLPLVEGDSNLLEQAFLNLGLNACQAMPNGGQLRITARPAQKRTVEVEVADTGVGIAPENLSRIFDLYFTTKTDGSGIGLSMVFRTVQLHDGEIEVQSTSGHGTTFKVTLRQA